MNINRINGMGYVRAERIPGGGYRLFFRGSGNEVFPGQRFPTAHAARMAYAVELVKRQQEANR